MFDISSLRKEDIGHLLTVLPERFAKDPKAAVDDLLPWADELTELCHMQCGLFIATTIYLVGALTASQ